MTQDEHLVPARAGRDLDNTLAELVQGKPYGRYEKYGASPAETNLREYLFIILKRKWLILSLTVVVTSLVTIQAFRQPNVYEGETTLRIEAKPRSVLATKEVVIQGQADPNFWGTQLKLLENPALARQVILTLDLQHNPAFLGGQAQSSVFASLKRIVSREREVTAKAPATSDDTPVIGAEEMNQRQLTPEELVKLEPYEDAITGSETIEPVPATNLVKIHYRHTDPELAQKVANTLAEVFVYNNVERETLGSSKAEDQLAREIAAYQQKIHQEQEVQFNYAKAHDVPLTTGTEVNIEVQRQATYSGQLLDAENSRKTLQAAWEQASNATDPFTIPEVQKDERITKLRDRISELERERDALLVTYTSEWPAVKKLDVQLKPLKEDLAKRPQEIIAAMKKSYEAAAAREKSLHAAYATQHGVTTQQTKAQIDMAAMSAEMETDKQYLSTLMQKQREYTATQGERTSDVKVETPSRLPHSPVGPARFRNIMIALLISLGAGIGLAFLLDYLDDTLKTVDDVDRYIHLPALAMIPAHRTERPRLRGGVAPVTPEQSTALALVDDVRSPIAESYRHLRTSLLLSSAGQPPKRILVTSSQPSEGKTTTAVNTAFMLAQTGAEVLILDCDLRRPRLHAHFNLPNARGLTNLLSGETDMESLIHTYDKLPNLKLLTSGPMPPNPAELLGSEEMRRLLLALSEKFQHIIVDSPPAISFTDASILSTVVDGVILVVHGGRSSRAVVRRAKQQLLDVGAHIFGVVLNNVKIEQHDYYYSSYYASYYKSGYYYGDEDDNATAGQGAGAS